MNTIATKKITSLRLNIDLYSYIETLAKKENRSVNNFIETALVKATDFETPNEETLKAMEEVRNNKESLKRYNNAKSLFKDLETL
ncbi:MAG TPA: hypothetical protein VFQ86_07070 [Arachidicoccus soli]|nr:hypothetical protein [Arachidicoccus soli]